MPYINGQRVSLQEWQDRYSSLKVLHTGPNGENPAGDPALDEETGAPVEEEKPKARRSARSQKQAKAAIADALGKKASALADLDVSGADEDES
jgi:hypothetical protein